MGPLGQTCPLPLHTSHIEGVPDASVVYPQGLPLGCGRAKTLSITVTAAEGTTPDEGDGAETWVVAVVDAASGGTTMGSCG